MVTYSSKELEPSWGTDVGSLAEESVGSSTHSKWACPRAPDPNQAAVRPLPTSLGPSPIQQGHQEYCKLSEVSRPCTSGTPQVPNAHSSNRPSLHSRATRDSRLSIWSWSRLRVRSASRDLRL